MSNLIIKLKGGTGNQLFQLVAALSLAKVYKKTCKFSIEDINKNKYNRKLEINSLLKFFKVQKVKNKSSKTKIFLDQYDIDHPIFFSIYSPLSFKDCAEIQLEGYFTNYRIHNKEIIKKLKSFIKSFNTVEKFKVENFVALHLRELHGTGSNKINTSIDNLDINYYTKSLNEIFRKLSNTKIKDVIVFSDMWKNPEKSILIPKIKILLKDLGVKYINGDEIINSPLEILNIFSFAKFCIISNSTLSWWGGYLCDGEVFSPVMNLWEPDLKVPDNWSQIYANEIMPKTHHNKLVFEPSFLSPKEIDFRIYSSQRIKIINSTRALCSKLKLKNNFGFLRKWLKSKGLSPKNSYSTYF